MCHRKFNVTPTTVRDYVPEGTRLVVRHLHPGNSTPDQRRIKGGKVSPYVTHAMLVPKNTNNGIRQRVLANASAICAPHDNPNRSLSYRIAAGRAMRAYYGRREVR
jgi:hypothetical protein